MGSPQDWWMGKPGGQFQLHSDMLPTGNWIWYCLLMARNKGHSILWGTYQQTHLRQIVACPCCKTISKNDKSEKSLFQHVSFALQLVQHMQASCTSIPQPQSFQSLLVIWVSSRGQGKRETRQGIWFFLDIHTIFKVLILVEEKATTFKWEGIHRHPAWLKRERAFLAHLFAAAKTAALESNTPQAEKKQKSSSHFHSTSE